MWGLTASRTRSTLAIAAGVLCAAQLAEGAARADAPAGGMETTHGPSLITVDNSNADSWLEVDRTLNTLAPLSKGTAGSDHDGGGGAIDQHVTNSPDARTRATPQEGQELPDFEEEEPGAPEGDDPEGDADQEPAAGGPQANGAGSQGPRGTGPCPPGAPAGQKESPACP